MRYTEHYCGVRLERFPFCTNKKVIRILHSSQLRSVGLFYEGIKKSDFLSFDSEKDLFRLHKSIKKAGKQYRISLFLLHFHFGVKNTKNASNT